MPRTVGHVCLNLIEDLVDDGPSPELFLRAVRVASQIRAGQREGRVPQHPSLNTWVAALESAAIEQDEERLLVILTDVEKYYE